MGKKEINIKIEGKNQINVTIGGRTAIGKSTIMWALIKTLIDNGVEVEMDDPDHRSIEHLQHSMEHDITLEQRFQLLGPKMKVKIIERNTK